MRYWIIFAVAIFCTACMPQNTGTLTPEVNVAIEPFVEPTATPDCLHADGVRLDGSHAHERHKGRLAHQWIASGGKYHILHLARSPDIRTWNSHPENL